MYSSSFHIYSYLGARENQGREWGQGASVILGPGPRWPGSQASKDEIKRSSALVIKAFNIDFIFWEKAGYASFDDPETLQGESVDKEVIENDGIQFSVTRGALPSDAALEESLNEVKGLYLRKFGESYYGAPTE